MRRAAGHAAIALCGALACTQAKAWGGLLWADPTPSQDQLSLGASAWAYPRSPEGGHTQLRLTPALEYRRHDGWFVSTESGLGLDVSRDPDWQLGARLWPQFGRDQRDATAALPALGPRLQKQLFANHMVGGVLMLQSALSAGGGVRQDGVQMELGLASGLPLPGGTVGLGLSATWANAAERRAYVGVPASGWSDVAWTVGFDHRFTDAWQRWHVDAQVQQARMLGDLASTTSGKPRTAVLSLWRDW